MFYSFIKILFGAAVKIFFRQIEIIGEENIPTDKPVILVSNHPSAFMDPLVLGIIFKKPLYFFARADIFKPGFVNWITKKAHVSPIYRIVDGAGSLEKNDEVFSNAAKLLQENKTLLLFGEGFTDEIFIRRVKPMKKGSMRIALGAEEKFDFNLDVKIVCAGINYSDPSSFRSDIVISYSKPIDVSKYKNLFRKHSNKCMQELNKEIYSSLKNEVVHIENADNSELLEQLLIISEKGLNNDSGKFLPMEKRWEFSKKLAEALNHLTAEKISYLKEKCSNYFSILNNLKISNGFVEKNHLIIQRILFLIFTFPVFILGVINNYLPVKFSTFLSKKISQRPVFWSSTDMAFSIITVPLYYVILLGVLKFYFHIKFIFLLPEILLLVPSGIFAFNYAKNFYFLKQSFAFNRFSGKEKVKAEKIFEMQKELEVEVEKLIS